MVLELRKGINADVIINNLYKQTALQTTFPCNMVALVDATPQTLNLKQFLQHFLDFRSGLVHVVNCLVTRCAVPAMRCASCIFWASGQALCMLSTVWSRCVLSCYALCMLHVVPAACCACCASCDNRCKLVLSQVLLYIFPHLVVASSICLLLNLPSSNHVLGLRQESLKPLSYLLQPFYPTCNIGRQLGSTYTVCHAPQRETACQACMPIPFRPQPTPPHFDRLHMQNHAHL